MTEHQQCPSLEEVIETTNKLYRSQWKVIITLLFHDQEQDVRDRMWIMWSLARIAANEQYLDELNKVVQDVYEKSKKQEEKVDNPI